MKRKINWLLAFLVVFAVAASSCKTAQPLGDRLSSLPSASSQELPGTASETSRDAAPDAFSVDRVQAQGLPQYGRRDQRGGFEALSEAGRVLYTRLLDSFYQISEEKNERGLYDATPVLIRDLGLEDGELGQALKAAQQDNPQVFWLASTYSVGDTIQLYSHLPPAECNRRVALLNDSVMQILSAMPQGLSEFEREEYLVRALSELCQYDSEAARSDSRNSWAAYTAFGALYNRKAVCEGYARAMQLLSSYTDLSSRLITGWGKTERHMWNLIQIDGLWYHLDPTWIDGDSGLVLEYFNLTDEQISRSHTVDPPASEDGDSFNLPFPASVSDAANYYRVRGIAVNGRDDADLAGEELARRVEAGETDIPLVVPDGEDYEQVMNRLFEQHVIFDYIRKANILLGSVQIDAGHLQFLEAPVCRGATVFLNCQ